MKSLIALLPMALCLTACSLPYPGEFAPVHTRFKAKNPVYIIPDCTPGGSKPQLSACPPMAGPSGPLPRKR